MDKSEGCSLVCNEVLGRMSTGFQGRCFLEAALSAALLVLVALDLSTCAGSEARGKGLR